MAKVKLSAIQLIAPLSRREETLDYLQRRGVLELREPEPGDALRSETCAEALLETDRKLSAVRSAREILQRASPEKKPLTALLEPRRALTGEAYEALRRETEEKTLAMCGEIAALDGERADLEAACIRKQTQLDSLRAWADAGVPLRAGHTAATAYQPGSFKGNRTREALLSMLAAAAPELTDLELEIVSADENATNVMVYCMRKEERQVDDALRSIGFVPAPHTGDEPPRQLMEKTQKELAADRERIAGIERRLVSLAEHRADLDFTEDCLTVSREKYAATEKLAGTNRVFVLEGYAAEKNAEKIKAYAEAHLDAAVQLSPADDDENAPVLLKNGFFAAPLENITAMYSMPSKDDLDPTGVMAFFYYFFFGMMLSDAGYGLIIALATGGLLLFRRDLEQKMRNTLKMYFFCGVSTVFWGAMYGSWFGDAGSVICREFLGRPGFNPLPPLWTDAVTDLMNVLIICFIFGLVHLFTGVLMKAVTDWKHGRRFDAFCDSVPTFLTILGVAPIFFSLFIQDTPPAGYSGLALFLFNAVHAAHTALGAVSNYLLIAGLVLVVLTGGRSAKSIGGKIGGGLYEVYNLIGGYLGDVLSYARLLALGLATGVIAQVMNMLGTLPKSQPLKLIVFIVVFIIGHVANLAINIIGAYVHTNRLQYVEFFGKFYEGGGRPFTPFEAKTKYYKFKEEIES